MWLRGTRRCRSSQEKFPVRQHRRAANLRLLLQLLRLERSRLGLGTGPGKHTARHGHQRCAPQQRQDLTKKSTPHASWRARPRLSLVGIPLFPRRSIVLPRAGRRDKEKRQRGAYVQAC
eukprot:Amastigsp_a5126_9.p2 type:complete len:119 gc:universal Amastigsp_a5126_9:247-603(+)